MTMPSVLLVGKPWRGGLAHYLRGALEAALPGKVTWLPTYPETAAARRAYRKDRTAWRANLAATVERTAYDAALFVNHHPELVGVPHSERHTVWLTDDARMEAEAFAPYGQVYVSDPGYEEQTKARAGDAFQGVVPFACAPAIHRPLSNARPRPSRIGTISNRDPKRDQHLSTLFAAGLRPIVIGNYFARHPLFWRHPHCFRPSVSNEGMGRAYERFGVSVNIHAAVVRGGTNMRTFECAAYGVPQLVEWRPGLEALFEPGQEVETYREPDEAVERLERLQNAPAKLQAMANAAQKRARAEHTYTHRLAALFRGVLDTHWFAG